MQRKVMVLAILVFVLMLSAVSVQADAGNGDGTVDIQVRVFMDTNNDMRSNGDFGLQGWVVELSGIAPKQTAVTGPNGYASFQGLDPNRTYTVRLIQSQHGGIPHETGWRLARSNAQPSVQYVGNRVIVAAPAYTVQPADFLPRVNGDNEAWIHFSTIRVNRITVGGANQGDVIEFRRVPDGRLIETRTAGPNGFASVVGGGFFYEQTYNVINITQGETVTVTIPYSWQPKVDFSGAGSCVDCTYP